MTRSASLAAAAIAGLALFPSPSVAAERAESVQSVRMVTAPECLLTPNAALDTERNQTLESAGIIATLVGGIAGDLVGAGLNAIGEALEEASKEKGIVSEATGHFLSGRVEPPGGAFRTARFVPAESVCLILYSPGTAALAGLGSEPKIDLLRQTAARAQAPLQGFDPGTGALTLEGKKALEAAGVTAIPSLYVEAQVWALREGVVVRPVLVWYRDQMKGAPSKMAASELHVSLATPAAPSTVDIGAPFAGARMILPRVKPGDLLTWNDLRASTSIVMPPRPTAGYIDTQVTAVNTLHTTVGTRKQEERTAKRSFESAERKHTAKPTAETAEALAAATTVYTDAQSDRAAAETARDAFTGMRAGPVNAKLRFVVIREPNQFGLALAKALKTRSAATGTAVGTAITDAMTPKPQWTGDDTAYVQALNALDAKQREYDAAVASGDSAAIALKGDELRLAKAKLNEAAVKLNRPIPYPSLF